MEEVIRWAILGVVCANATMSVIEKDMGKRNNHLLWAILLLCSTMADEIVFGAVK